MGFDKAKAIRAAEKYLAQGKIPAAIQEYRRIVEYDAEDYTALNTLGDLFARVDKKQDAVACYRKVAEHYREQGFSLKAIAMYKKVTRFNPHDHQTALALASLYEQQGLAVDARAQYLVAADALTRAGESREALEVLRRIANLDPSNTQIRLRLAEGYASEDLPDLAAEAYAEAGARLEARGEHEQALDAFNKALELRPAMHAALQGLVAAHSALGTGDEAAEVLERAAKARPSDLELRAMLARAYVEAEDAARAEQAADELVTSDPSSFPLIFDVVRVYLQQGSVADAARLLGRVAEQALSGRRDETLLELLQEVLARDPEQMEALHLLVHAYSWQRDEERLRVALERLADAAETSGAAEEERRALTQLVRLAPAEPRYASRLEALGGPLEEEGAPPAAADEVPTFESFMLNDESFAAPPARAAQETTPAEFEWNAVPAPGAADASSSFADLNDLTDSAPAAEYDFSGAHTPAAGQASAEGFPEIDFGAPTPAPAADARRDSTRVEQMLLQELESVDFYLGQGYFDIARDTLEMLERQYGQHAEVEKRRALLPPDMLPAEPSAAAPAEVFVAGEPFAAPADSSDVPEFVSFEFAGEALSAEPLTEEASGVAAGATAEQTEKPRSPAQAAPPRAGADAATTPPAAGLDPGLAALFDEFREAVEDDGGDADGADYETHFQMGLAYREMGLLDDAVVEFQKAAAMAAPGDGTPRFLQCCNLLGHCFMEKGMPRPAVTWFKKGLETPGHTEDEYQALRFELGAAYEQLGDTGRAIEVFSEVYAVDVSYRGVAERLRELQNAVNRQS
jgi:tetratricopeptide (TPR) repeat protein